MSKPDIITVPTEELTFAFSYIIQECFKYNINISFTFSVVVSVIKSGIYILRYFDVGMVRTLV